MKFYERTHQNKALSSEKLKTKNKKASVSWYV